MRCFIMANRQWLYRSEIRGLNNKELRKEYRRQRQVANKRIKRLREAGLEYKHYDLFPPLKGLTNSEIEEQLSDASRFLRRERTKVSTERKFLQHEVAILQKDYKWVNMSNIYDVIHFLEDLHKQLGEKAYSSDDALDVLEQSERLKIPSDVFKENFDYFKNNLDKLEKVKPLEDVKSIGFDDLKKVIEKI